VWYGIGKRQANITFAVLAECSSGEGGDTGFGQQAICELLALKSRACDVGKQIERAQRLQATNSSNIIQTIDKYIPPPLELLNHMPGDLLTCRSEGLYRRK